MTKNHLKARAAPRTWNIPRKDAVFVVRPNPGSQGMETTLPLGLLLRQLGVGTTKKEINHLLKSTPTTVNGVRRWDYRFGVGLMDTVTIGDTAVVLTMDEQGRLAPKTIDAKSAAQKQAQVRGIAPVRGGKLQLALTDGRTTLIGEKDAAKYPRGATVVVSVPKGEIRAVHTLAPKAHVLLVSGKHRGTRGTVESIDGQHVVITTAQGPISTTRRAAFVLAAEAAGGKA
jgi:small subunit ribosomal protein S4e